MVSNAELRARARAQLGNNIFSNNWLMALVVCLIVSAITAFLGFTGIGAVLLAGIAAFALVNIFLPLARGKEKVDLADMIKDFGSRAGTLFLLGILQNIFIALWSLLFVIPGIVKTYSYSMSYYLAYDHPDWDWKQCIDESRRLMNGNKARLFLLDLSFIGWLIVGALACGVGTLWVAPYMNAARANFYEELVGNAAPSVSL